MELGPMWICWGITSVTLTMTVPFTCLCKCYAIINLNLNNDISQQLKSHKGVIFLFLRIKYLADEMVKCILEMSNGLKYVQRPQYVVSRLGTYNKLGHMLSAYWSCRYMWLRCIANGYMFPLHEFLSRWQLVLHVITINRSCNRRLEVIGRDQVTGDRRLFKSRSQCSTHISNTSLWF